MRDDDDLPFDDKQTLHTRSMQDGGEVVTGRLATDTLQSVGARAMTMDKTIFVADDFDPNDPVDQALYAHEAFHQGESGGEHEHHGGEDHEEAQAKEVETMVLHRRAQGEDFGSIMRDVQDRQFQDPSQQKDAPNDPKGADDPMESYRALSKAGRTHTSIVREMTKQIFGDIIRGEEEKALRAPTSPRREIRS